MGILLLLRWLLALSVLLTSSSPKTVMVCASDALPSLTTPTESSSSIPSDASSSTSYSYAYSSSPADDKTRTIRVWGSLPATYVGKVAAFGNALSEPLAANLMLPPDDPWLCEFPASLQNVTSELFQENYVLQPQALALFVSLNNCSVEQKARIALEIRQKVTPRLELLILYSTNPQDAELKSLELDADSNWHQSIDAHMEKEKNALGILHVPQRYAAGIDLRIRVNTNSRMKDPRLGRNDNDDWKLEIEVAPLGYDGVRGGGGGSGGGYYGSPGSSGSSSSGSSYGRDTDFNAGSMYWFRIILFTMLIISPCIRAAYLWHAGGGRFHWRRNENGRIIGILYIPPMDAWLSTGGMQHEQEPTTGKLTLEQFNELPEIRYTSNHTAESSSQSNSNSNDDNNSDNDEEEINVNVMAVDDQADKAVLESSKRQTKILKKTVSIESNDSSGGDSALSDEIPGLVPNRTALTESESMETVYSCSSADAEPVIDLVPCDSHESTEDALEQGDAAAAVELLKENVDQEANTEMEDAIIPNVTEGTATDENSDTLNAEPTEAQESSSEPSSPRAQATTSHMCSICIDDFEEGESLTLLPRCQHAFHKDCILPWLTERQGCCPLCKCSVLEEESDGENDDANENEPGSVANAEAGNNAGADSAAQTTNDDDNEVSVEHQIVEAPEQPSTNQSHASLQQR